MSNPHPEAPEGRDVDPVWEAYRWPEVETSWWPDSGGYFVARLKEHPSCMSDGETRDEAFAALLRLIPEYISALGAFLAEEANPRGPNDEGDNDLAPVEASNPRTPLASEVVDDNRRGTGAPLDVEAAAGLLREAVARGEIAPGLVDGELGIYCWWCGNGAWHGEEHKMRHSDDCFLGRVRAILEKHGARP